MAITTELVGRLGGGLSWTKVTGKQKSIAWNVDVAKTILTTVQLDKTKTYIFACKYNYTSGTPGGSYLAFGESPTGVGIQKWGFGPDGVPVLSGANTYPVMVAHPAIATGNFFVRILPGYQSGTHVLSADIYYAEMPTI